MTNEDIESRLSEHSIRPTTNRILVMRALERSEHPRSLMDLEAEIDSLDKSSISRTLSLFHANGMVHVVEDGRGVAHYELCESHHNHADEDDDMHAHFYCERCHRVYCLDDVAVPPVNVPEGFSVARVNYMLTGICADCADQR